MKINNILEKNQVFQECSLILISSVSTDNKLILKLSYI